MKVGLDALVAEIARCIDWNLLEWDPKFDALSRPHRMHLILANLVREDVARAEKSDGGVGVRWRPSHRLDSYFGVKRHGIADEYEDAETPVCIPKLAHLKSCKRMANWLRHTRSTPLPTLQCIGWECWSIAAKKTACVSSTSRQILSKGSRNKSEEVI